MFLRIILEVEGRSRRLVAGKPAAPRALTSRARRNEKGTIATPPEENFDGDETGLRAGLLHDNDSMIEARVCRGALNHTAVTKE